MTLSFQENPVWSPLGSCQSMRMLERVFFGGGMPFLTPTARIREETLESGSYFSGSRISDSIPFKLMPPWTFCADIVVSGSRYIGYMFLGT